MLKGNVVENYEAVGYTELGWNSGSIPPWGGAPPFCVQLWIKT